MFLYFGYSTVKIFERDRKPKRTQGGAAEWYPFGGYFRNANITRDNPISTISAECNYIEIEN